MTANQLAGAPQTGEIKGYELTMREGKKTREMGYLSFDKLHQYGACIADDPETCVAKLKDMKRRFGITEFVLWFNIGGIDKAHVERAMKLAAEKVMPFVLARDCSSSPQRSCRRRNTPRPRPARERSRRG